MTKAALFFARSVFNICVLGYIDDFILFGSTLEEICLHRDIFLVFMSLLGFQIREEKSSLVPSHIVKYLGFWWDSQNMIVYLPSKKFNKISSDVDSFLEAGGLSVKNLERLLGRLESIRFVFENAPLFYRSMQRLLNRNRGKYKRFLCLDKNLSAKAELLWWSEVFSKKYSCRSLLARPVTVTIYSDAAGKRNIFDKCSKSSEYNASSFRGHGAFDDRGNFIQHEWSDREINWHINRQELFGAVQALKVMALPGDHVLLRLDNSTAEAYLRKRGGTKSFKLNSLAVEIGRWMLENDIGLTLQHVSSEDNDVADMLSRFHMDFWEFSLHKETFDYIVAFFKEQVGLVPTCDLFASRLTARMNVYCSWRKDKEAIAQDAFLMKNWTEFPYIFPPTPLLPKVLKEIASRKTKCLLVAPNWPFKNWFPLLRRMKLISLPLPHSQICLVHKVRPYVEAKIDPLCVFLLDGGRMSD